MVRLLVRLGWLSLYWLVREVAHEYATAVTDYITNELQLLNSYDTWHGIVGRLVCDSD